jgi:valyl-tRNA synthetase
MPIPKAYEPQDHEDKIYQTWETKGYFQAKVNPDKKPFTISMPPPNATGELHLGHATMLAIEDIMIRSRRMQGYETLWLPGTDHAAIATQSKVEEILATSGITRYDLGRDAFLQKVQEFVENSKSTIRNQIRKMGSSCDWSREGYTFSDKLNNAVSEVFVRMYNDGLIYRGGRIVNWDPKLQTTVADDEVEYKESKGKFYYLKYGPFTIGTARPETKFLDNIVVVHPDDERYKQYHNQELTVDWILGPIKARVIADPCIDPEFGTGVMTITPAHSLVDFELAQKYNLDSPKIIDLNGNLLETAGEFAGLNLKEARTKVIERLTEKGLVEKIDENYTNNLATNYRGGGLIEPQIMDQWFIDVNKPVVPWKGEKHSLKAIMLDVVRSNEIEIIPNRFNKTYFHWIENLRDWCISRQIWWGHRIPAWYKDGETIVQKEQPGPDYRQDEDTLDTWFSSGLWTFSTLGWPEQTEELKYFHPTSVLETGYDILFFWVARMILMSIYALGEVPFKQVYLHGLVLDKNGQKMSKSKGNGIDPLDMIAKYGTDAVRLSLVMGATPGNNVRLYEEKIAGFRNFINKLWNSARFTLLTVQESPEVDYKNLKFPTNTLADRWIVARLGETIDKVTELTSAHQYSEAGTLIYEFLWNEYCDWYLEISKGEAKNPQLLLAIMQTILKLLHPFTPFVTEALWEKLGNGEHLIAQSWPTKDNMQIDTNATTMMNKIIEIIYKIRSKRTELKLEPAKFINATIFAGSDLELVQQNIDIIKRLARIGELTILAEGEKVADSAQIVLENGQQIFIHLAGLIDFAAEFAKVNKEITTTESLIETLTKKLENPGFRNNAKPEIIATEEEKLEALNQKLKALRASAAELKPE